ncbi:MAG TPA: hypothetical protein G4O20_07800 [Dehalococcoidia bacterium]|nr:hypothetical protein [Dehalococcoidia bacterium]
MAEQLGKIEKPEAKEFTGKRKIYLVPLLFSGKNSPEDYTEKYRRYWQQVSEHVANLEAKLGKVGHIYHESVYQAGKEGLEAMQKLNTDSSQLAREKSQRGALIEAVEDRALAEESIDWERFILMGFISQKVAQQVSQLYVEALRKRYENIARQIDETLVADEAGLLFIREGHMVQFPEDIEVFSVAPPALDEIHRWQREQLSGEKKGEPEK